MCGLSFELSQEETVGRSLTLTVLECQRHTSIKVMTTDLSDIRPSVLYCKTNIIRLTQLSACHNNQTVTTARLSQQPDCHNNQTVTTTRLSQQPDCHNSQTVTNFTSSTVRLSYYQNVSITTSVRLSQLSECETVSTVTVSKLSETFLPST